MVPFDISRMTADDIARLLVEHAEKRLFARYSKNPTDAHAGREHSGGPQQTLNRLIDDLYQDNPRKYRASSATKDDDRREELLCLCIIENAHNIARWLLEPEPTDEKGIMRDLWESRPFDCRVGVPSDTGKYSYGFSIDPQNNVLKGYVCDQMRVVLLRKSPSPYGFVRVTAYPTASENAISLKPDAVERMLENTRSWREGSLGIVERAWLKACCNPRTETDGVMFVPEDDALRIYLTGPRDYIELYSARGQVFARHAGTTIDPASICHQISSLPGAKNSLPFVEALMGNLGIEQRYNELEPELGPDDSISFD